jgi:hypothetical protein
MNLTQLADDYLRAGRRQGNRPGTEIAYGWALKHWLRVAGDRRIAPRTSHYGSKRGRP